jgi:hypothetical protein
MIARFLVLVLLGIFLSPAHAGGNKVEPLAKWEGSLDDLALQKAAPKNGVIADENAREALWKAWNIKSEKPVDVDFSKHLLLLATTRGSRLNVMPSLSKDGDLKVAAIATRDLRPGFRYQILLISRVGVKSVKGKALADR